MNKSGKILLALATIFAFQSSATSSGNVELGVNINTRSYPSPDLQSGATLFDDFVTGLTANNQPTGSLGWAILSAGSGGIHWASDGTFPAVYAGHLGVVAMFTGVANNGTGAGALTLVASQDHPGLGASQTWQWEIKTPSALSTAGVEYVIEMGCGTGELTGSFTAAAAAAFRYKRTVSTNWIADTCNAGTCTELTTADSTDFAVAINTWYVFKMVWSSDGTTVSFYVAPGGTRNFVLLGSSTTNLPDATHACYPAMQIYKASTTTTSREFALDWFKLDMVYNSLR